LKRDEYSKDLKYNEQLTIVTIGKRIDWKRRLLLATWGDVI